MNKKVNYVCIEHRVVSRSGFIGAGSTHCSVDGAPMVNVGDRFPIPKRHDDKGWRELARFVDQVLERRAYVTHRLERPWWKTAQAHRLLARWS